MITSHARRIAALVGALAWPIALAAQNAGAPAAAASSVEDATSTLTNAVEVGVANQNADSFRFGKYTGLTDKGALGIGNVIIRGRDHSDDGTRSWEFLGTNLGLSSRGVSAKYGEQGSWSASFLFTEIPFHQSDSAFSLFGDTGTARLTLPAGLPANTTAANGRQLLSFLQPQNYSLDRTIVGGGVRVQARTPWTFSLNVSHEHKDGLKEQSLSVNSRTDPVAFPEPVDYDTNSAEASAAYDRQKLHLQFGYLYAGFTDANAAVAVPSPYVGVSNTPVGTLLQYALPPSSSAHDVNFAAAYRVTPDVRLNVNLGYGVQLQNNALLPYTLNSNFPAGVLPRASVDGKVLTSLAQFKIAAHPAAKLDVSAGYTYDKRDDRTPQNAYQAVEEPDWTTALNWSVPYGFTDQTAKLDGSYRFTRRTKLAANYTYQTRERTIAEVTRQAENSGRVRLSQDFGVGTAYVSYLYGVRNAADYQPYAFDIALGNLTSAPPLLPYPNNASINGYALEPNYYLFRRFFEADRTRKEVKSGANLDLGESLSLELSGRRTRDDYTHSSYGMTAAESWSADADLVYTLEGYVSLDAFYTYESILSDQTSLASTGIVSNLPTAQWTFTNNYHDRVHTVGLGATWEAIRGKLRVGPRYELSLGNTDIDVVSGPGAGTSAQYVSAPVPQIRTSSYGVKFFGDYLVRPAITLRVVYDYEHLDTTDPALNTGPLPNTAATNLAGVVGAPAYGWLLHGDASGVYRIHLATASLIWRF